MKLFVLLGLLALASAVPVKEAVKKVHPWIVNGQEAPPHSVPHQCWIYVEGNGVAWLGAGSLISSRFVLTAAHVADNAVYGNVLLGAHNINIAEDTQRRIDIARFIVFPSWNPDGIQNDMALLELADPVEFTPEIQPVALMNPDQGDLAGKYGRASGWGVSFDGGPVSDVLMYIDARIISNDECNDAFGDTHPYQVCIAGDGATVCSGDSGGPLTVDGAVAGVASFVFAGCPVDQPATFTRVSSYWDWIHTNSDL